MQESYHVTQLPLFVLEKQCRSCPQNGLQDINNFPKDKHSKDEHYYKCKQCIKEYYQANRSKEIQRTKKYAENNKEYVRERRKDYRKKNKEKIQKYNSEYEQSRAEEIKERKRNYRKRTMEHRYQYNKKYVERNREKVREGVHRYYLNNREDVLRSVAQYRDNNRAKISERVRIYNSKNKDKRLARHQKRRAQKRAGGSFSAQEWINLKSLCNHTCLCCGKQEPEIKLTLDHVIPLARGGKNTIDNIQPLCLKCNMKKGTKSTDYRSWTYFGDPEPPQS